MKKKVLLCMMLGLVAVTLFGCGKSTSDVVQSHMSEITETYFYGECEDFYVSLSSGMRENDYKMDGKSGENTEFALLSLKPTENILLKAIAVEVKVGEESTNLELKINGMNGCYMADLGKKIGAQETVELVYGTKTVALENVSKEFQIDSKKAIEIACEQMKDKIESFKSGWKFNAECYLRVMDKKANNFDNLFWCFTIVGQNNENFSIIISTVDGSVLAKSK